MGIVCGAVDCEHNGEMNECELKKITLNDCYYHTVNEGFQHFWRCKQYEESEISKKNRETFEKYFEWLKL